MFYRIRNSLNFSEALFALTIVAAGALFTLALAHQYKSQRLEQRNALLNKINLRFQADLRSREFALFQVANFFQASNEVTFKEWTQFAQPILTAFPEFTGLGYSPLVNAAELDKVSMLGKQQDPNFRLFELTPKGPSELQSRPRYSPIVYVTTQDDRTRALGLDLFSEPTRNKLLRSIEISQQTSISAPLDLVGRPDQSSVLTGTPILSNADVEGFVIGAINISQMLESIFSGLPIDLKDLALRDLNSSERLLYGTADRVNWDDPPASGTERILQIYDFGGRTWQMAIDMHKIQAPIWTHLAWLIPLLIAVLILREIMRRRETLIETQAEVTKATTQLYDANRELEARGDELAESLRRVKRKNRELESFAYVASHDLKSPLRGIRNLSQWIAEDLKEFDAPASVLEHSDRMSKLTDKMSGLISGLLRYSRTTVQQSKEFIDLGQLLEDIAENTSLQTRPFEFSHNAHQQFTGDLSSLRQVLSALLENAVKHNDHAIPKVNVKVRGQHNLSIEVADNGPGIPIEARERIFEVFQTLKPSGDEVAGMGLPIARKIVSHYGFEINIKENDMHGISFSFEWPVNNIHPERDAA